jgi:hypothetical protein
MEDGIVTIQANHEGKDSNYVQNHVLRDVITDVWGADVDCNRAAGQKRVARFSYTTFREDWNLAKSHIVAVMSLVSEKLALCMAEGYSVKLDGIGTFNAKLGVRNDVLPDAFEPGEPSHNAMSIRVMGVAFRADKELIRNTSRKCVLKRGGVSRIKKSKLTLEERIEKAREFLRKNMFMRVPDYVRLTGLSRTAASMELRKLALNPSSGITSRGERSQKYYVLR